ncbi:DUF4153 domain-containing protein [bacterium]|nr:DUF4153 domain-containing protein [bacterium]
MGISRRFPSYQHVAGSAAATLKRFPLTLLAAVVASAAAVALIESDGGEHASLINRILSTAALGIPLFIALTAFAERLFNRYSRRLLFQLGGVVLLMIYYISLPDDPFDLYTDTLRFVLLFAGLHFLVAFVPYIGGAQIQGFWQYNKSLFLRILISALYTGVLYVGLAIALAALDYLFGVDINEDYYAKMWMIMVGCFNTIFFLAGFPRDLPALNGEMSYPKGLKIFTQFVLLPLVALYFIILFAYELKIIVQWELPKGWVSQLVLWYAVVGTLSLLLLHPLREIAENKWIKTFMTWFFRALVPLIVLLFFAILTRIADYGITANRYLVVALAIGLAVVTLYFMFARAKDIRIIPIVLAVLAFVAAYGPWSAFSISESSQKSRLEEILERNDMLVDGHMVAADGELSFEDRREMSSIIDYLNDWHGIDALSPYLSDSMLLALDTLPKYSRSTEVVAMLGFQYVAPWRTPEEGAYYSLNTADWGSLKVDGFDYMIRLQGVPMPDASMAYGFGDDTVFVALDTITTTMFLSLTRELEDSTRTAVLPLADTLGVLALKPMRGWAQPSEEMMFDIACGDFVARLVLTNVGGYIRDDGPHVDTFSGILLIRKTKTE